MQKKSFIQKTLKNSQLWVLCFSAVIFLLVFRFYPMYGAQLAFKDYNPLAGITGSPWVGFEHFIEFFRNYISSRIILNTLLLSSLTLLISFPFPVLLALLLNSLKNAFFKKSVQMVTYIPYFISTVVMVTIITEVLNPHDGLVTLILRFFRLPVNNILAQPELFRPIYIISHIWQNSGYSAVVYLASLSAVNPVLYEAAIIDGANKWQRILHIDIPGIMPTIAVIFILNTGHIMNIGFEKVFLLQNDLNLITSEIITTYVYKIGLVNANFSFAAAVGLFNSFVNLVLLFSVNQFLKKFLRHSMW